MSIDRLKFRVWSKRDKMYLNTTDQYLDCNGALCEHRYVWGKWEMVHDIDANVLVVEQCTGLKDADGKLIYEGDILSCERFGATAVFYDSDTLFFWAGGVSIYLLDPKEYGWRIVGNIHENPELLEKTKRIPIASF